MAIFFGMSSLMYIASGSGALSSSSGSSRVHERRDTREARLALEDLPLGRQVVTDEALDLGAWPDNAHVAAQHIPELRQLVQFPFPQPSPHGIDPVVAGRRHERAGNRATHRSELVERKGHSASADARLAKQHRARGSDLHNAGNDEERKRDSRERNDRDDHVEHPADHGRTSSSSDAFGTGAVRG